MTRSSAFLVMLIAATLQALPASASAEAAPNKASLALKAARKGALARQRGDLVKACRSFERAVALTPTWGIAQLELGRCYRLLGDPEGLAKKHLLEALRWLPKWGLIHIELAKLAEDNRRMEAAGRAYREAEKLAPADVRAASGAARLAPMASSALRMVRLRRILKRQPHNLALINALAQEAESNGALAEAEGLLLRAMKQSRYPGQAAARLARFALRHQRKKALSAAKRVLKHKGKRRQR